MHILNTPGDIGGMVKDRESDREIAEHFLKRVGIQQAGHWIKGNNVRMHVSLLSEEFQWTKYRIVIEHRCQNMLAWFQESEQHSIEAVGAVGGEDHLRWGRDIQESRDLGAALLKQ